MAPALTEPISPTEKLTNTAAAANTSPATRSSSKKLETIKNNKLSNSAREKRSFNGNIIKNQTTASNLRLARSRETQRHIANSSLSAETNTSPPVEQTTTSVKKPLAEKARVDKDSITNHTTVEKHTEANEQMGLSAAPANSKNKTNIKNNSATSLEEAVKNEQAKAEDTSTAQLLADLTNEAITAEICLRNQLKDVDLVKESEGNSSPLQQSNDLAILKAVAAVSPTVSVLETKDDTAHMEVQSHELKSKLSPVQKNQNKAESSPDSSLSGASDRTLHEDQAHNKYDFSTERSVSTLPDDSTAAPCSPQETSTTTPYIEGETTKPLHPPTGPDVDMETLSVQESPIGSPDCDSESRKQKASSEHVQELPPVSTDSTMTASEVEDNLEERLSQLDGTAIDSPPPNHDVDRDVTIKAADNVDSCTTPPRTPTLQQQSLSQDMQHIQQQLQNTPPTPISQQVQTHHLQPQNCFTPQSTSSTATSLGSANIPQSFIKEAEGGAELEDQDIEEVFKVLKGFEGGTTSDLNVCDLNVLFNEVYMKMNETDMGSNSGSGSVAAAVQSSNSGVVNPSIQLVKPTELEEGQLDVEKRQQQMQRKIEFLMRRLRKQQSRYMCKHTSEEIGGLFEWSSRQSFKGVTHNTHALNSSVTGLSNTDIGAAQDPSKYFLKVISARPPATYWKDVQEASIPATQITALLRKIESVANAQQLRITPATNFCNITAPRKSKKALNEAQTAAMSSSYISGKATSTLAEGRSEDVVVSTLDENVSDELTQVAGLLQNEMCEVQKALDSDATESSSGGESADEMVTYNNQQQQTLPITKRAAWRYSRDRAAIASRWSWLLSQISDLEIKIRQHSELHQEIVRSKGPVVCQVENDHKIVDIGNLETDKDDLSGACRTRGFITTQFRKRKLIQTTNIHTISKKAARPSSIKCGCQWPLHPCALCTGRSDPTAPRDLPDTMMMSDRIALLDSGYHPVLSFKDNVNNALHFEAIAKQSEWQQRVMRCQAKNIAKSVWKAERDAISAASGGHNSSSSLKKNNENAPTKRRYVKKKDRIVNEDKTMSSSGANSSAALRIEAAASHSKGPGSSITEAANGTATLTTTSTTPLVANKVAKSQACHIGDRIMKEPSIPLAHIPTSSSTMTTTSTSTHQTSNCPPAKYDQYNLNQIPSSLISNKSNKNRKNSSASVATNSHQYHHNYNNTNHLYNGDLNYTIPNDWAAGGIDGVTGVRSRTSSPIHGISSSNYHKHERSLERKNRASYDIDNIVIPYSVAAATRVEILPYKEIPTPKWRFVVMEGEEKSKGLKVTNIEKCTGPSTSNGYLIDREFSKNLQNAENLTDNNKTIAETDDDMSDNIKENESITTHFSCGSSIASEHKEKTYDCNAISRKSVENDGYMDEPDYKKMKRGKHVINSYAVENSLNGSEFNESIEEDISDDAMILRHERALAEERSKFQTYLKFPWSTRSRANRRIDSRAESSGANTPDPSSPASHAPCVGSGDQESIPSPSNPSTPLTPLDTISEAGDFSSSFLGVGNLTLGSRQRQERRRTTSTKRERELERRSSTPDSKELIPPYEPMKFPLSDEQLDELMSAMPIEHNTESKRFDECYLPGGGGSTKSYRCTNAGGYTSKRSSRSSTLCGSDRRKGTNKNISADDAQENGYELMYDEEYDDYPKHHLAPNDDHLTADNCTDAGGANTNDQDDVVFDPYNTFACTQKQREKAESDGDSTETEPFQDEDPNDPEWRGESEDRSRKKV